MLAAIWAAVLLPSLLRSRTATSPIDGVRSFERAMGILSGNRHAKRSAGTGRWVMVPSEVTLPQRRRSKVMERRRKLFVRLLGAITITLAVGFIPGVRWAWYVNIACDLLFGLYIWRLLAIKKQVDVPAASAPRLAAVPTPAPAPSKAVFSPSAPPVPHAQPAEVADDIIAELASRTG
ncbi:MAG: hypothetical protein ACYDCC_15205 [Actinomycetota bacterium]